MHLHISRKNAGLHLAVLAACRCNESVVQASALIGRGGGREAGAVATRGVRRQRELADDQQATRCALAVHILHAQIHLALRVTEDAQLQKLGQQLVALDLGVALLGAQQHQ